VVINEQAEKLVGFVVSDSNPAQVVLFSKVVSITAEALTIDNAEDIISEVESPVMHSSLHGVTRLKGKALYNHAGEKVGHVHTYYFNETTGAISAYQTEEKLKEVERTEEPVAGPVDPTAPESLEDKKREAEELFSHIQA
jgi:uncharacterized protein YrrD